MDSLTCLHTRVSVSRLSDPGPDADQLQDMLRAAIRAPDHGRIRPWRFLVVEGDDRRRLGELFARARQEADPDTARKKLDKLRTNPLRAPTLLVVVAEPESGHKVPEAEQVWATVAAAQNVVLAAHAQGIGAMWRTGEAAWLDGVKKGLGFGERAVIVGFIYLGTPAEPVHAPRDEDPFEYVVAFPQEL